MVKRFTKNNCSIEPLDLHGIKHIDVVKFVENYIFKHQDRCPLKIITGNSLKMKKIVTNTLDLHGFSYKDGDYYNRGYIVVLN